MKHLINSRSVKIITVSQGGWIIAAIFVQPFRSGKEIAVKVDFWKLLKSTMGFN